MQTANEFAKRIRKMKGDEYREGAYENRISLENEHTSARVMFVTG